MSSSGGTASASRRAHLLGAAGALVIAFSAILVRLSGAAPSTAALFRCLYALPVLGLLAWHEQRRFGPRAWHDRGIAALAGVLFAADLTLWHHAIEAVGAGLGTVLASIQVVMVGLAAWAVLGERPSRRVLLAVPIVLAGVLAISGVLEEGAYGEDPLAGVLFGLGTAVAYAGFLLVLRHGNRDPRRPAGPLLDASAAAALAALLGGLVTGDVDLAPAWPAHGWLLALALSSQVLAWVLISLALPRLPALVTSLLLMLQPVGAVVLAMLLLGERPSVVQLLGVVVVLGGVLFATFRRSPRPPRAGEPAPVAAMVEPAQRRMA